MTPALVVLAAAHAPRVIQWPLSRADRHLLHQVMATITTKCAMSAELYDLRELSALVGACARAQYVPEELLLPLQIRVATAVRGMMPQDAAGHITAIATHLSRLRVKAPRLWEALGSCALSVLGHASATDVAGLLAAHARAGVANTALFEAAVGRAVDKMRFAAPQDVATLMWAVARADHGCPRPLVRAVTSHLASRSADYGVAQLATIAGACAKLGVTEGELRRRLGARAAEALREEAAAVSSLTPLAPHLRHRPDGSAAAQPVTSQAVSVLVAGLASMGPPEPGVLRAAAALLIEVATGGGGAAAPVQREDVESVAAALRRAGMDEECAALLQVFGLDPGLGGGESASRG